jgi:hypothetical protein
MIYNWGAVHIIWTIGSISFLIESDYLPGSWFSSNEGCLSGLKLLVSAQAGMPVVDMDRSFTITTPLLIYSGRNLSVHRVSFVYSRCIPKTMFCLKKAPAL